MRLFLNSFVKVFWFEDECDLLVEDQLLLEGEEVFFLSEDDFEKDEEFKDEVGVLEQDSFDVEMESVFELDIIEVIVDGFFKCMCRELSQDKIGGDDYEIMLFVFESGKLCELCNGDLSDNWLCEKKNGGFDMIFVYLDINEQNNNDFYFIKNKLLNIFK